MLQTRDLPWDICHLLYHYIHDHYSHIAIYITLLQKSITMAIHRFLMGIRGFHYYRGTGRDLDAWQPFVGECLTFKQEPENQHDQFAVAVMRDSTQIVGHVPIEISRIIFFAVEHGCLIEAIVEETKMYQSPITQGGLEIKSMVKCTWTDEGIRILQDRIAERYSFETRLTDDFDSILRDIERGLVLDDSEEDLIDQFDDVLTIDVIDDEDDD